MKKNIGFITFALIIAAIIVAVRIDAATPAGASVQHLGNSTMAPTAPGNRTDAKGTINVIALDVLQQNDKWKAYVGNVSGKLTLDDAQSYTIYDWSIVGSVVGTVFATRNSTVVWSKINCSNLTYIRDEQTFLSMTASASDSIENTFSSKNHTPFTVADTNVANCSYTSLYVNDTVQPKNSSAAYQEILLYDYTGAFVYASRVNDNSLNYRGLGTYDFQMIVGEREVVGPLVTYYFFVELQ